MIVGRGGEMAGTVGGGSGEGDVISKALDLLGGDRTDWLQVEMWGSEKKPGAMVCGGQMKLLLEPLSSPRDLPWITTLLHELEQGRAAYIVRALSGENHSTATIVSLCDDALQSLWSFDYPSSPLGDLPAGNHVVQSIPGPSGEGELILERVSPPDYLIIVGGGHIALPLCAMAAPLGFRVTVIDDRPELATRNRFPGAATIECGDYTALLEKIPGGETAYFSLLTKSYLIDVDVLPVILKKQSRYIGMIGSRRRISTVKRVLVERGISPLELEEIHAPIGLDIGAVTPAEIAASIAAELISVRQAPPGSAMRDNNRD